MMMVIHRCPCIAARHLSAVRISQLARRLKQWTVCTAACSWLGIKLQRLPPSAENRLRGRLSARTVGRQWPIIFSVVALGSAQAASCHRVRSSSNGNSAMIGRGAHSKQKISKPILQPTCLLSQCPFQLQGPVSKPKFSSRNP